MDNFFLRSGEILTWVDALVTFIFLFKVLITYVESKNSFQGKKMIKPFNQIGRHTLYIFLYHMVFVSVQNRLVSRGDPFQIIHYFFGLAFVVLMPVTLEIGMDKVKNAFKEFMAGVKVV